MAEENGFLVGAMIKMGSTNKKDHWIPIWDPTALVRVARLAQLRSCRRQAVGKQRSSALHLIFRVSPTYKQKIPKPTKVDFGILAIGYEKDILRDLY